ncbi:DUF6404 family protein [Vibrio sp. DNB22_19_1]|uniref:DUF6404 family protein n=1 Tax=unclassified Vibrio TaxID=2614977 RepID=UPI00406A51DE
MDKAEFIQIHLIEKGVPADLTKPKPFIWSKYKDSNDAPLVFQSPIKVVLIYCLLAGPLWGGLMWLTIWHNEPERWPIYLIASAFFGVSGGLVDVYRAYKARKRLGETNWKNWCKRNYE